MSTKTTLESIAAKVETVQVGGVDAFSAVELWNSDNPDAQLESLQGSTGRFALVFHEDSQFETEKNGRNQITAETINVGVLVSNSTWQGDPPPGANDPLDVVDAVVEALLGRWDDLFTVSVSTVERFRPDEAQGTAAARIIYRIGLSVKIRARHLRNLTS